MNFITRHEFLCAPEVFFSPAVYFHPDYHTGLYRELRFRSVEVLEHREEGDRIFEVRRKRPERDFPAPVRRALGIEQVEYREEAEYDRKLMTYQFRVFSNVLTDKIRIEGCYRILPVQGVPGRCIREVDMTIEVNLFAVGGRVEKHVAEDLRRSYDVAAEYTRRWLTERLPPSAS